MGDRRQLTRRAALALIGSGGALAAGRTFGLTNTTVDRASKFEVVDDPQALLGIDGLSGCDDEQLTLTNNVGEDLTVTVSTSAIDVTRPGAGKTTTFPLGSDQQRVVEFGSDTDARDDVRFEASTGTGQRVDLTRSVTLTPVDPEVYQLEAKHSGLVMGVQNGGTEIRQYNASRGNVQSDWAFVLNDDCSYRIENVDAGGVVSVQNPNNQASPLVREAWDGNDWQRWTVLPNDDGTYRLRNRFSGQVIDVSEASTSQGATVLQWPWKGESDDENQSWSFTQTGTAGYRTVDTTSRSDATFDTSNLMIDAAGEDMWTTVDEYGAIVDEDVSGDVVARTSVVGQEDTGVWAKAGIMFANDAAAAGTSVGDIKVNVTPSNGFEMTWDSDGDGFHDDVTAAGQASYPCELRLTKSGQDFTGEYSTDGGANWNSLGTVSIPQTSTTQDVSLVCCSFNSNMKSRVEFNGFSVQ
jgi:hypothetical protein